MKVPIEHKGRHRISRVNVYGRIGDWSAEGSPRWGSQHPNGCLHVVEYNGHGISPLPENASSPYRATDRGRPSCPNQASEGSIR